MEARAGGAQPPFWKKHYDEDTLMYPHLDWLVQFSSARWTPTNMHGFEAMPTTLQNQKKWLTAAYGSSWPRGISNMEQLLEKYERHKQEYLQMERQHQREQMTARERAEEEKEEAIAEMVRQARAGLGAEGEAGTPVFDKEWKDLVPAERSAARNLNFTEETWNADDWSLGALAAHRALHLPCRPLI
jgi:hypothetical protein